MWRSVLALASGIVRATAGVYQRAAGRRRRFGFRLGLVDLPQPARVHQCTRTGGDAIAQASRMI